MRKIFRIIGLVLTIIIAGLAGIIAYANLALPNVGDAPVLEVNKTQQMVERGRYLANTVTVCIDCHSTRDWSKFSGPVIPGTFGKGGELFDHSMGFPGVYYSKNITPAGISRYTDGELYRLITTGVTKEGKAMFPVMPYPYYGKMDDEDIHAIIAYLRTLSPIDNQVPESSPDFPMSIILNTIPVKGSPVKRPEYKDTLAYGAYLANASACMECHTKAEKGQLIRELAFSGGREFNFPGFTLRSSNITPDNETGIGRWTKEAFVQRFKTYADSTYEAPAVEPGEFNTIMPWTMYGNMKEEDLAALYTYLRSLTPIKNAVVKFTPAPQIQ